MDGVSGTANDDTITGLVGASGSYGAGDNINGGAGTDTLNLVFSSGDSAGGLVQLVNVENVNARLLGTAATAVTINANDWTGVTTLSNASSLATSLLQVSGLATTTKVSLMGDTDINVGFINTTTATDAVSVALTSAGTFGTSSVHTLAGTGGLSTAELDLDLANAGLLTKVNVEVNGGANLARLEAGSNVTTYTLTGAGSAVLVTDDTITSFNAAALTGGVDVSFSGASDVVAVGGAGNDTFRFGTTYSNGDSIDGGAGADTVALTVAGFNRNLNTTNVESATVTFSEAAGGTLNASASTIAAFTLAAGTAGNAASVSQIANNATITLTDDDIGGLTLDYATGAATTTINIGSASGTVAVSTATITDVAAITVNSIGVSGTVGGSIGSATFDSDAKSLSINTSGGEADLVFGTGVVGLGGITAVTITSNGSADATFASASFGGTSLNSIALNANGVGVVTAGAVTAEKLTSVVLSGNDIVLGAVLAGNQATADGQTLDTRIALVQGATSTMTVGNITVTGQGNLNIDVTQNGTGATATFGTINLADAIATGDSTVGLNVGAITVGVNGSVNVGAVTVSTASTAGAQLNVGAVVIGQDGYYGVSSIAASAGLLNVDVGALSVNVGASAEFNIGDVLSTAGVIGSTDLTIGTGATATFGARNASSIGAISLNAVGGTGAELTIGTMTAAQTIGAIELAGTDGASATFGAMGASAVGAIAVSGAMDVTFGTITANTIGSISATQLGKSGVFTIDLSGVSGAAEINLGAATNTIISGDGRDVITLLAGSTGNDNIRYSTANATGTDSIIGFGAGTTGADQIEIGVTGLGLVGQSAGGVALTADAVVDLFFVSAGTATMTAADSIIVLGTAYASTAGMLAAIVDGGAQEIVLNGTAATGSTYTIAWTDGSDTMVSMLTVSASGVSLTTGGITTLAVLTGVTPGALVAANFDFV